MRLIDADAAIAKMNDEIKKWQKKNFDVAYGILFGVAVLKDAPTIEVEPKWIPISERAPGAAHVLVTLKRDEDDYEVTELDYAADVACGGRFAQYVTAWMPLPEPHKDGRKYRGCSGELSNNYGPLGGGGKNETS